jgi:hypothetical protein
MPADPFACRECGAILAEKYRDLEKVRCPACGRAECHPGIHVLPVSAGPPVRIAVHAEPYWLAIPPAPPADVGMATGLGKAPEAPAGPTPGDDPTAYVPVGELWPNRPEFKRPSAVTKYLDKLPNEPFPSGIRNQRKGHRRFVHLGDWHRHFEEKDRRASEELGAEPSQEVIDGIERRKAQERQHKQRK